MSSATIANWFKLARQDRHLRPKVAIYYVTGQCNFNCAYCEDFGSRRNAGNENPLPLEQAKHILSVIRSGVDSLFLTGGEPLTNPHIDALISHAKRDLRFRELTLITNGSLLPAHESLLSQVDRLIISLDSINPVAWSGVIGMPEETAESIQRNIEWAAHLQQHYKFVMSVNTVLSPETLSGAQAVLDFCFKNGVLISFSPQSVNNWPHYDLTISEEYQTFINKLIKLKQKGAPIVGSSAYLKMLARFEPYDCYPTLVPRIYPNGDLAYPCRPLEKGNNGQGGRVINLLNETRWDYAWTKAHSLYGKPPRNCHSCFQQCYAEPSLMQSKPLSLLWETVRYPASRKGKLTTYAPG
jgi:MoaA/NifB/PqqE/SkfB family radical SAM enzyme